MEYDKFFNGFFTGINYWDSKNAINMWQNFDANVIENDFVTLKNAGITHLRIFPLWPVFQPITALYKTTGVMEYVINEDILPNTEAGKAGVSETAMQNFETFCYLAEKHGLKLIVALITGHMSFRNYAPTAFDGKNLLTDPTVIKWQRKFVTYFVKRLKNQKTIIAWDLGNEPIHLQDLKGGNYPHDSFYLWCSVIYGAVKSVDNERPVLSGLDTFEIENGYLNLKNIGDVCDVHTTHPYNIFHTNSSPINSMLPIIDLAYRCEICEDISKRPTFPQEFGSIGYLNCSKQTEADFYRACLYTTFSHNFHGAMWWCAFDQGHFDYAPYRWNTIGSNYGFFDKDNVPKPIVKENLKFKNTITKIGGNLPPIKTDATIIIQRDEEKADNVNLMRTTYALLSQANITPNFVYATDEIKPSPVYIFPCPESNLSILKQTLDSVLKEVEKGSTLYISLDEGLIRYIPEITGVNFSCREKLNETTNLLFDGEVLPIKSTYTYIFESGNAEILATNNNSTPVFFKNAYGNGSIYLLTLPLERYLTDNPAYFYKKGLGNYSKIYREITKTINANHIADTNNQFVLSTEHILPDGNGYVCLINYSSFTETITLSIKNGYKVYDLNDNLITNLSLTFTSNECLILKVKK